METTLLIFALSWLIVKLIDTLPAAGQPWTGRVVLKVAVLVVAIVLLIIHYGLVHAHLPR